jgi:hypothetical protein
VLCRLGLRTHRFCMQNVDSDGRNTRRLNAYGKSEVPRKGKIRNRRRPGARGRWLLCHRGGAQTAHATSSPLLTTSEYENTPFGGCTRPQAGLSFGANKGKSAVGHAARAPRFDLLDKGKPAARRGANTKGLSLRRGSRVAERSASDVLDGRRPGGGIARRRPGNPMRRVGWRPVSPTGRNEPVRTGCRGVTKKQRS